MNNRDTDIDIRLNSDQDNGRTRGTRRINGLQIPKLSYVDIFSLPNIPAKKFQKVSSIDNFIKTFAKSQ